VAVALIVAAGTGERLGADRPKAFVALAGRPMLEWSVEAVQALAAVQLVVVALPPGERWMPAEPATAGVLATVAGGLTRSHSVRNALAAAAVGDEEAVVVHDAARPLAPPALFARVLAELEASGAEAAIAAARVSDTIKRSDAERRVTATLDRAWLWAVQTPQAFRAGALRRALQAPDEVLASATDDAWLIERSGGTVRLVESPAENLKVTTPFDLRVAELLLGERC
jgi:2-C-methyl-D-erythritol 4-phosphate cytidylyltransferase